MGGVARRRKRDGERRRTSRERVEDVFVCGEKEIADGARVGRAFGARFPRARTRSRARARARPRRGDDRFPTARAVRRDAGEPADVAGGGGGPRGVAGGRGLLLRRRRGRGRRRRRKKRRRLRRRERRERNRASWFSPFGVRPRPRVPALARRVRADAEQRARGRADGAGARPGDGASEPAGPRVRGFAAGQPHVRFPRARRRGRARGVRRAGGQAAAVHRGGRRGGGRVRGVSTFIIRDYERNLW